MRSWRVLAVLLAGSLNFITPLAAQTPKADGKTVPAWIWLGKDALPQQTVYFRKEITLKAKIVGAKLYGACDNAMTIYVNGKEAISGDNWEKPVFRDVIDLFDKPAKGSDAVRNVIAVKAYNSEGAAGLLLSLVIESAKAGNNYIMSDATWRVSDKAEKGWNEATFND